jgi:phenylacetate-CoA ligase
MLTLQSIINWRKPLIYSLLYLSGSKIPKRLKSIAFLDQLSLEKKLAYQKSKLEQLLIHAQHNVPYYHEVLRDTGVVVGGEVNLEKFSSIPILTKEIIRKEASNLYSRDYKKRRPYHNSSAGSTGVPVKFIQDQYYSDWNIANKIYYKKQVEQEIGDKELRIWGSFDEFFSGSDKWSLRARNWLYNRLELNSLKMSGKDLLNVFSKWNKFQPCWVEAYSNSLYEVSKVALNSNIKLASPKGVLTTGGNLYPEMKKAVEDAFCCKVFNRYGSREVGDVACSKGENKLYLSLWNHYVEILDSKMTPCSAGEVGKFHITVLNNYSMPFIRYDIGDLAQKAEDLLTINSIEGREIQLFRTKEGTVISAGFMIMLIGIIFNEGNIYKFQVVQKEYDLVVIKAVLEVEQGFDASRQKIEGAIKKVMGEECRIEWQFVEDIEHLKSGKYLYSISEVH